jgi:hypothetical protein
MDHTSSDVEPCPLCFALVIDLYEHIIWHGEEPQGTRFRRRYEKDVDAQKRVAGTKARRINNPGQL